MITQYEVSPLIRKELPELYNHEVCSQTSLEVYIFMNHFADFTVELVRNHSYPVARKCFVLGKILFKHTAMLYTPGAVSQAIEKT